MAAVKKVAKKSAPKATKEKPRSTTQARTTENDIDVAVGELMEDIDGHELAGSSVPQETTVAFYRAIITSCRERVETIQAEMGEDAEDEEEDIDLDDIDDDEDE